MGEVANTHKACNPTQKHPLHRKSANRLGYKTKDPSQCDLKDSMEMQCTGPSHPRDTSSALYILPGNPTSS